MKTDSFHPFFIDKIPIYQALKRFHIKMTILPKKYFCFLYRLSLTLALIQNSV